MEGGVGDLQERAVLRKAGRAEIQNVGRRAPFLIFDGSWGVEFRNFLPGGGRFLAKLHGRAGEDRRIFGALDDDFQEAASRGWIVDREQRCVMPVGGEIEDV